MDSSAQQLELFSAQDLERRATPTTFLDLPFELRVQIYRHYVPRGYVIFNNARSLRPDVEFDFIFYAERANRMLRLFPQVPFTTDFLVVCKQVSEECLNILYGENRFELELAREAQAVLRRAFTEENIRRITDVHVIANLTAPVPDMRLLPQPDPQFWAMVFPHLTSFVLQATEHANCMNATANRGVVADGSLGERLLYNWKERVEPYFELFGRLLRDVEDNIKVDISVGSETFMTAERHIPRSCPVRMVNMAPSVCRWSQCALRE